MRKVIAIINVIIYIIAFIVIQSACNSIMTKEWQSIVLSIIIGIITGVVLTISCVAITVMLWDDKKENSDDI